MKKPRTVILLLSALSSLASLTAYAGDSVDCAGLKKWNSDKSYHKDDRVWYDAGGEHYNTYECNQDQCHGAGHNEPDYNSKIWKFVGNCKSSPN
jgi:hypothetical protein